MEDARLSHAGIFRSPCAQSSFLSKTTEPQASSCTGTEPQNMPQHPHESPKGRFVTKRGWLSEVYATDDSPPTARIPDSPFTVTMSKTTSPPIDDNILPRFSFHNEQTSHWESVEENQQCHPALTFPEDQHTLAAKSEKQSRDDQIKAVREALLRTRSFSCDNFGLTPHATARSAVTGSTSPSARRKSLRRRSERTASLQRRKSSAFGEIRAADHEMCDLAQDLLTTMDAEVVRKTEVPAISGKPVEMVQTHDSPGAPDAKASIGDRIDENMGELRGLSEDVDQLTRDLRALKQLLRGGE